MQYKLELELTSVFGGDGITRDVPVETLKLSRKRTKVVESTLGIPVDPDVTTEQTTEVKMEPVHTFRMEDGLPVLRLGGAHGKFWGAIRGAGKQLYSLGDKDFRAYKALVEQIIVSPDYCPIKPEGMNGSVEFVDEGIPQILAGRSGGMIVQHYDTIPKATTEVVLTFPDALKKKIDRLLEQVQVGTHLNKRRTVINILSITEG